MRIGVLFVVLAARALPQADVATAHLKGIVTDPSAAFVATATASDGALDVVDVGGGTGGFAVPLAQAGHRVTMLVKHSYPEYEAACKSESSMRRARWSDRSTAPAW